MTGGKKLLPNAWFKQRLSQKQKPEKQRDSDGLIKIALDLQIG